ncbi:hypothetical protein JQX09_24685 [Sulfitobacter pseudonitzschiae]|uniref:Uncharacterized protein n=1 Tax=Pseudosulfitobacter pseudonitzschiae TaxID=1402135 RepID=A0A9Q2NLY4_9RHOB|nr:hypothetical protein [Pseudosulfitobacter pseudonitzschiae]MBM2295110.1 hypothetical protein [Pseudosulfitobacter pseudonitzschiae]MBM2299331.1 hypothetical protein [Pseudosulfitobacter pseudonitzschiae]MBM2304944.1 hypothetical protein [Pseudosulfitobacter pseudonitzschiae]MBM2314721.1 hypothetical protein [Pseudosulfitobacter pseudonitzschiae]MBM2319629.1 hypothetical protein [Pseudosulfitobacter pseudonitzschiae]
MAKRFKANKSKPKAKGTSRKRATPSMVHIQKAYLIADENYRDALYTCIQNVCLLELQYREDTEKAERFCKDKFWKGRKSRPNLDQPQELLHYMFVFMCGDTPDANKNASLYKKAARGVMNSQVPRENIAQALKDGGGIRKMAEAVKKEAETERSTALVEDEKGNKARNIPKGKLPRENIAAEIKKRGDIRILASPKAERSDGKESDHGVDRIAKPTSSSAVAANASTSSKVFSRNNSEVLFVHTDGCLDDILEGLKGGNIRMEISLGESEPDGFKRVEFIDYWPV